MSKLLAMRIAFIFTALLGLWLALSGCAELSGPSAGNGLFVARLQDCKAAADIPASDNFASGEIPAVVYVNYGGLTITIRVSDIHSGAIVWNKTDYIPQDRSTGWWSLKALPGGSYKAELLLGGTLRQSYSFNVAKQAVRKK